MRKTVRSPIFYPALAILLATPMAIADEPSSVLPRNYRSWTHVSSMVVTDGEHGMYGFHNVYANPPAVARLQESRPRAYPDGATFVVSVYEVMTKDGLTSAGAKRRDVLQYKDAKATATGGWRFAAFDVSGRRIAIDPAACFGCHAAAKDADYVFATFTR